MELCQLTLKAHIRWVNMRAYNFFFVDQSSPTFSANMGGVAVDQMLFRFSTCPDLPEIFVIKVESYQKSRRIFRHPKF